MKNIHYKNIIGIKRNAEFPNMLDVELTNVEKLKECDSFECHFVMYPYSRKIRSQDILFVPYEDYIRDMSNNISSAYSKIINRFQEIFGIFLGILIIAFFLLVKPEDLISVESTVSILGAYFIGKELWDDIEQILKNISKGLKLRYVDRYFNYQLERNTTLTNYSIFAKKQVFGISSVLADKMDFIRQSSQETLRLFFKTKRIPACTENSAHILSMQFDDRLINELQREGYMLGIKLSFNKRKFLFVHAFEMFQSLSREKKGCLTSCGEWHDNAIFYKNTYKLGKIKYFKNEGILADDSIIKFE